MDKKKEPVKDEPQNEKEQPIGNWVNPDPSEQYKECPIGKSQP